MERWAILCNQTSGGYDARRLEEIRRVLREGGVETRVVPTAYRGHATDLCRAMSGVDCVAVYGGDGTLNEAANGLLGRDLPLAFLPGGTANVMAHELGLPQNPVRAARLLLKGSARAIYPGMIGERAFLLMAGFGFDGMAVHRVSPRLKSRVGKLAYVWAGLQAFAAHHPPLQVSNGGVPVPGGQWAIVCRAKHYGGPYVIDPAAGLAQPELSLIVMPHRGVLPFLVGSLGLRLRRPRGGAVVQHGTAFRIQSDAPIPVQVDGDAFAIGRDFTLGLASRPLRLRFPAGGQT
jgi:diacylglycerol kinase family enzyme